MRQSGANGRGSGTGDPIRRVRTGRTRIVLLGVIGLLLAGLSSLVIATSSAHALGPVTGQPTTTTVTVDDPSASVPEDGYVNFVIKVTYSGGAGVSTEGAINVYTGSDLLCSTTDQSYGAQAVATYPDSYAGVGECSAYVGLTPGVYPITADFLGNGVPVTGPAASVGLTTLTVTSAPPVPTNPDLLITSAASVTFGTSVTYSFDYFDSPSGALLPITVFIGSQLLCEGYGACTSTAAPIGTDTATAVWNSLTETAILTVSAPPVSTPPPPPTPTPTPTPTPAPAPTHLRSLRPRQPRPITATGWWARTAGSLRSVTPSSMGRRVTFICSGRWWASHPPQTMRATGWWLQTGESLRSVMPSTTAPSPVSGSLLPGPNQSKRLNAPIVGMVPSADGGGSSWWAVTEESLPLGTPSLKGLALVIGGALGRCRGRDA